MPAAKTAPRRPVKLSDEQVQEALALASGADSVELKLTVPETAHRSAIEALELDPLDVQIRLVSFFDTPDLQLNKRGLVVRARRVQGREDDSVVKLRPVVPADLPEHLRTSPGMVVELDAMPGGFVCSASMKARLGSDTEVKKVTRGKRSARKLFSKAQRAFYEQHAPEGLGIDDLTQLGPIFVLKARTFPRNFDQKMVTELWLYPDGSRILELSTKCAPDQMFQVAAEGRAYFTELGIDLSGQQQTKTKSALEQFTQHLPAAG